VQGVLTHVVCPGLDLCVQPVLVLVPEGRVSDEQDVEDDPARPDVDRLPVRLLLQHLGAEVAGSAGKTCLIRRRLLKMQMHLSWRASSSMKRGGGKRCTFLELDKFRETDAYFIARTTNGPDRVMAGAKVHKLESHVD
jgi:hypothetical protein